MQKNQPLLPAPHNFFALTRTKPDCYYPPVRVDFNSNPTPRTTPPSILPSFNHDRKFFTPTFLLPADKHYYQSNSAAQRSKFSQKIQAEGPDISSPDEAMQQLSFEVKEGDSKYCQICQLKFEDYWQHVAEQSHARRIHLSPSTAHIRELCTSFTTEMGNCTEEYPQKSGSKTVSRRRSRKGGQGKRDLQHCLSSDMVKALQGNCSTQIMAERSPLVWP